MSRITTIGACNAKIGNWCTPYAMLAIYRHAWMDVLLDEIKVPLHTLPRWEFLFSPCFVGIFMQVARGMELSEIILCMLIFICYP